MNPKENDNEIIELTDEELNEIFADDEQELYRSNKESKAFCLAFFVLQYRKTRTGQPVRVATVRGTVAVPACVPVRAEAHRASLVIRSNKKHKAFGVCR